MLATNLPIGDVEVELVVWGYAQDQTWVLKYMQLAAALAADTVISVTKFKDVYLLS